MKKEERTYTRLEILDRITPQALMCAGGSVLAQIHNLLGDYESVEFVEAFSRFAEIKKETEGGLTISENDAN